MPAPEIKTVCDMLPGDEGKTVNGHVFAVVRPAENVSAEPESAHVNAMLITKGRKVTQLFDGDVDWEWGIKRRSCNGKR